MATSTVEDYVKQIYLIQQELKGSTAPMGKLSDAMRITPGTTTTMVKALADDGLVVYEPRVGVKLTSKGKSLALAVLRRHRIAELFLVQVLGMDWSEVHDDAERLEHAISDKVLDKMDEMLNRPTRDPHGDPIPAMDGRLRHPESRSLSESPEGETVTVARILDQSQNFLKYIRDTGMAPGSSLKILTRNAIAEYMQVRLENGQDVSLSTRVADKIAVE
ncbi:MAG TPA: metal-dependent transcriptional regulator [Kiritimatiellia bacterium]|nr:metal-dependent transcriptional regulator [Kiritimatiellia bacterium]